jgi:hypothetical protein
MCILFITGISFLEWIILKIFNYFCYKNSIGKFPIYAYFPGEHRASRVRLKGLSQKDTLFPFYKCKKTSIKRTARTVPPDLFLMELFPGLRGHTAKKGNQREGGLL